MAKDVKVVVQINKPLTQEKQEKLQLLICLFLASEIADIKNAEVYVVAENEAVPEFVSSN